MVNILEELKEKGETMIPIVTEARFFHLGVSALYGLEIAKMIPSAISTIVSSFYQVVVKNTLSILYTAPTVENFVQLQKEAKCGKISDVNQSRSPQLKRAVHKLHLDASSALAKLNASPDYIQVLQKTLPANKIEAGDFAITQKLATNLNLLDQKMQQLWRAYLSGNKEGIQKAKQQLGADILGLEKAKAEINIRQQFLLSEIKKINDVLRQAPFMKEHVQLWRLDSHLEKKIEEANQQLVLDGRGALAYDRIPQFPK